MSHSQAIAFIVGRLCHFASEPILDLDGVLSNLVVHIGTTGKLAK